MNIFTQVLKYFPYVLAAVVAAEGAVGPGIKGSVKKSLILDSVTAAAAVGEAVPEAHIAQVSLLIDSTVKALNAAGVFSHAGPAA